MSKYGDFIEGCNLSTRRRKSYPQKEYLVKEVHFLGDILSNCKSPVRFCHNDLNFENIIVSPNTGSSGFLSFKYMCVIFLIL